METQSFQQSNNTNISREELAQKVAAMRIPTWLNQVSKLSVPLVALTIWTFSSALTCLPLISYFSKLNTLEQVIAIGFAPVFFATIFITISGLISRIAQKAIIAGKFPRLPEHPVYALRRIYGTCWTQVFYFKPVYSLALSIPILKKILFRAFGYKGDMSLTVYPDTWIRDLPLINAGKKVYLANRACIGTNLCINDGSILVGPVTMHDNSMVGHLAIFGLGTILGKGSELGVGVATGIRCKFHDNVSVKPKASLNHGVVVESGSSIGTCAIIGMKAKIGPNINIKAGASIPPGAIINTQKEADDYFSSETQSLQKHRASILSLLDLHEDHGNQGRGNRA